MGVRPSARPKRCLTTGQIVSLLGLVTAMKRVILVCCPLWIVALFESCDASNTVNPNPGRNCSFDLTLDQGVGSFTPVLYVATTATGATVTISANNATDLTAAYLYLHYDTTQYTPEKVIVGDML